MPAVRDATRTIVAALRQPTRWMRRPRQRRLYFTGAGEAKVNMRRSVRELRRYEHACPFDLHEGSAPQAACAPIKFAASVSDAGAFGCTAVCNIARRAARRSIDPGPALADIGMSRARVRARTFGPAQRASDFAARRFADPLMYRRAPFASRGPPGVEPIPGISQRNQWADGGGAPRRTAVT